MSNNVIQLFPKRQEYDHPMLPPLAHLIDDLAANLIDYTNYRMKEEGFPIDSEQCEVVLLMVHESIRALLCTSIGIDHPVAAFADDVFNIVKEPTDEQD